MRTRLTVLIIVSTILGQASVVQAQERPCPAGLPERPALSRHIEQSDILDGTLAYDEVLNHGEELFVARFNVCDGQGRPASTGGEVAREADEPSFTRISGPDSVSCASCHMQPGAGGAGDFVANVFVLAQNADPVLGTTSMMHSNHRNTLGMFGAGPIEMLAREMTMDLQVQRKAAAIRAAVQGQTVTIELVTKGVSFGTLTIAPDGTQDASGIEGVDGDLVIKPFHQSGTKVSIRQFSVSAMNHHHGMQAEERFDLNPEVLDPDFDRDGVRRELTVGDITAITLFQAALATPGRVLPEDPALRAAAIRGEQVFGEIGCTGCHVAELPLQSRFFGDPNPFNPSGNLADLSQTVSFDMTTQGRQPRLERRGEGAVVRAFTDLKRHNLCDPPEQAGAIRHFCNEQLADGRPDQDGRPGSEFFITRKLWDAGSSAPYGHRGDLTTLSEAILMHGGEGRAARDAFTELPFDDQRAVVEFLTSLQVLPEEEAGASLMTASQALVVLPAGLLLLSLLAGSLFRQSPRGQHGDPHDKG